MKKLKKSILAILVLICIMYFGCNRRLGLKYRMQCYGHSEKLGTTDFSKEMKSFEVEDSTKKLVFTSADTTIILNRIQEEKKFRHFRAYILCTGLDFLAPSYAYAYYEYENISAKFSNLLTAAISIDPIITKENGKRVEYINVSVSVGEFSSIRGRIPVVNEKSMRPPSKTGPIYFEYHGNTKVGDNSYDDIWICEKEFANGVNKSKIYFSQSEGILAFELVEFVKDRKGIVGHNPNEKIFYLQKVK